MTVLPTLLQNPPGVALKDGLANVWSPKVTSKLSIQTSQGSISSTDSDFFVTGASDGLVGQRSSSRDSVPMCHTASACTSWSMRESASARPSYRQDLFMMKRASDPTHSFETSACSSSLDAMLWTFGQMGPTRMMRIKNPYRVDALRIAEKHKGIRGACMRFVVGRCWRISVAVLIVASVIFMAVQCDLLVLVARGDLAYDDAGMVSWHVIEIVLLICFATEVIFRCIGSPTLYNRHLLLDAAIAIAWTVEVCLYHWAPPHSSLAVLSQAIPLLVAFRFLRLWQIIQVFHGVRALRPLYVALQGVPQSLPGFATSLAFITIFLLISAWPVLDIVKQHSVSATNTVAVARTWLYIEQFCSSLGSAMLGLMEPMLGGIDWTDLICPFISCSESHCTLLAVVLLMCFVVAHLAVIPLYGAIFIEQTWTASRQAAELAENEQLCIKESSVKCMQAVLARYDACGDGALTWHEFEIGLASSPKLLANMGGSLQLGSIAFKQLNIDGSGRVGINAFLFEMVRLTRISKSMDVMVLDYQQTKESRLYDKIFKRYVEDNKDVQAITCKILACVDAMVLDCGPLSEAILSKFELLRAERVLVDQTQAAKASAAALKLAALAGLPIAVQQRMAATKVQATFRCWRDRRQLSLRIAAAKANAADATFTAFQFAANAAAEDSPLVSTVLAPSSATGGARAAAASKDLWAENGFISVENLQSVGPHVGCLRETPRQLEPLHGGEMHRHETGLQHESIADVGANSTEGRCTDIVSYDAMEKCTASSISAVRPTTIRLSSSSSMTSKANHTPGPNGIASAIFALDGAAQPLAPRRMQVQVANDKKNACHGTLAARKSTTGKGNAPSVILRRRSAMTPWFHVLEKEGQPLMFKELKLGLRAGFKKA